MLRKLFEKYVPSLVAFVQEGNNGRAFTTPLRTTIPLTGLNLVAQLCSLLDSLLASVTGDDQNEPTLDATSMEALFIFACVWSIGGAIVQTAGSQERDHFDTFIKSVASLMILDSDSVPPSHLPEKSLYEYDHITLYAISRMAQCRHGCDEYCIVRRYYFDVNERYWKTWRSMVPEFEPPHDNRFASMLVPTVDTVRTTFLLDAFVRERKPILFVGESGTAKTVTISKYLESLPPNEMSVLSIAFSSKTTSIDVQRSIEESVQKRTREMSARYNLFYPTFLQLSSQVLGSYDAFVNCVQSSQIRSTHGQEARGVYGRLEHAQGGQLRHNAAHCTAEAAY